MSDSESASSSDSEDLNTTGLIATRAKRATAGNLYASLIANLDDEDVQKDLLAEDAEDVGDYEGSDKDDDDEDAFESSSDEEDQGPPKEGEAEDLEGEKQLKKQERAEAKKKRTLKDARMKIPGGLGRARKRVRLAEGVKDSDADGEGETTTPKPKKKSERANWLPSAEDGPTRQSSRALAVARRDIIQENLKQSFARSEKQRQVMQNAAERERSKKTKHAKLTQEQRLEKCVKVEEETSKELGRFEEEEAEKQRLREEALAKKRRRGIEGPVFRMWSGSCVWEGEKVKVARVEHGSLGEEELKEVGKPKAVVVEDVEDEATLGAQVEATNTTQAQAASDSTKPMPDEPQQHEALPASSTTATVNPAAADGPVSWLQGIEQYAAQPVSTPESSASGHGAAATPINGFTPSAPATTAHSPASYPPAPIQPQIYHGWPPGSQAFAFPHQIPMPLQAPTPAPAPAPAPAPPFLREQAQRTMLMLESFPELEIPAEPTKSSKRSKTLSAANATSTASADLFIPSSVQKLLLPDSYPPLNPLQSTYLLAKPRKKGLETILPTAPPKARCALTQWEAKFRDPKTAVPYADLHAFKALQRCLAGGAAWSGVLGAWVGPSIGSAGVVAKAGMGGRAARGVPDGFAGSVSGSAGEAAVKSEG